MEQPQQQQQQQQQQSQQQQQESRSEAPDRVFTEEEYPPPSGFPDATFGIDIQAVIRHWDPVGERSWDGQKDRPALPI